jgi:hypothetical protein
LRFFAINLGGRKKIKDLALKNFGKSANLMER